LSRTPARLRRPAPTLGQHTAEVLATLGYDRPAIERLAEAGVVMLGRA
jgi:crotonobetainyl-CoA:carnitine CoA-transferase CaiB-like acyl-CoA transferase